MAKKQAVPQDDVIDVGDRDVAVQQEQALARTDGEAVREWLRGVVEFFTTARALETSAKTTLAIARQLQPPTTEIADEKIQEFVKLTALDQKHVEEHWSVCQVLFGFHRRLTAARGRATAPLEEARGIANRLHTDYAETERRRAAREQEAIRYRREQEAQAERQRELDRLELAALKAEETSPTLSEREHVFIDAYTSTVGGWKGDPARCAELAGYKDALRAGPQLIVRPKILAAIQAKQQAAAIRMQAAARQAQPLEVTHTVVVPRIGRGVGVRGDVTTWSGEVLDSDATMAAFLAGDSGIPADLWQINPTKLNEYARALHEKLDLWPGVRAKKTTGVR